MNPDTVLTDIRCGCGGVCDSRELCPMRGNVEACDCSATPIVHERGQIGCRWYGYNADGEQYRVIILSEHVATYTSPEDAAEYFAQHCCVSCRNPQRRAAGYGRDCCDVQTWRREAAS